MPNPKYAWIFGGWLIKWGGWIITAGYILYWIAGIIL
jgi:hypothetical protein